MHVAPTTSGRAHWILLRTETLGTEWEVVIAGHAGTLLLPSRRAATAPSRYGLLNPPPSAELIGPDPFPVGPSPPAHHLGVDRADATSAIAMTQLLVWENVRARAPLRQVAGGSPTCRLKARLNAASDS